MEPEGFTRGRSYRRISLIPRLLWIYRNMLNLSRWGLVSISPNPQAGGPLLVGCPRMLIQYIRSYIRNLRTRHAVVTRTHLSWFLKMWLPEGEVCVSVSRISFITFFSQVGRLSVPRFGLFVFNVSWLVPLLHWTSALPVECAMQQARASHVMSTRKMSPTRHLSVASRITLCSDVC